MRTVKTILVSIVALAAVGLFESALAQTKSVGFWNGQLTLSLPTKAGKPKKISSSLYLIRPTNKKDKVVLYATREAISSDEKSLTNAQLARALKTLLEGQGYTVASLSAKGNTFSAKLTGYASMPWRKVGATAIRGAAQFVRTANGQLVGALALSDPKEWNRVQTREYRTAVTKSKVS